MATKSSTVSVIMPCYNAAAWLQDSVSSVLNQTYRDIELVVVDDGSSDDSLAVLERFQDSRVKVISQQNQGAAAARNTALNAATGDWIQYLDADDLLAADKIQSQMTAAQQADDAEVLTGEWARFTQSIDEARFDAQPHWHDFAPVDFLVSSWGQGWMMHPACWLVPRCVAEKAGPWDDKLSLDDDGEYFSRIVLASEGIRFVTGSKSYYRSNLLTSLSATRNDKALQSSYESACKKTSYLLDVEDSERTRKVCGRTLSAFAFDAYPYVPELRKDAQRRARELGVHKQVVFGGPKFRLMSRFLGWRLAKSLHGWMSRRS